MSKVKYHAGDGIVEVIIRDETGAREAKFTSNITDTKNISKIGYSLRSKYGIDFGAEPPKGFFDY